MSSDETYACSGYVIEITEESINTLNITKQDLKDQFGQEVYEDGGWEDMDVEDILEELSRESGTHIDPVIGANTVSPLLFRFDEDMDNSGDIDDGVGR